MKKILSILMAVVMCFTCLAGLSFTAGAEITNAVTAEVYTASVNENVSVTPKVTLTQAKVNYLKQNIEIANANELIEAGVTTVKLNAEMSYKSRIAQQTEATFTLERGKTTYSVEYNQYGKYAVTLTFVDETGATYCTATATVGLVAEEYNLAVLNASFPVIYFSLVVQDISKNADGEPVPTFIALERNDAYDWDKLPENVYALPLSTEEELNNGRSHFGDFGAEMAQYVKDLNELNQNSKYNLYTVDNYVDNYLHFLVENRIPDSQSHIYILSDGSGSYSNFNNVYNSENSVDIYNDMAKEYYRVKNLVYTTGKYDPLMVEKYIGVEGQTYSRMEKYAYVVAKEQPNAEWWLARVKGTLSSPDKDFLNSALAEASDSNGCIKVKAMNTMLSALQAKGDKAVDEFKAMYKFNNAMFAQAEKQGKKAMLILGTRVDLETNFEDYVKYVKKVYGDDFVYYYKGHPATPTGMYPEKQTQLDSLNVIDVESSIAAELILFFYPDIYLCGYRTSTFISVTNSEMACTLFGATKAYSTANDSYAGDMDAFISKIDISNAAYSAYKDYCQDSSKNYYLVEYNNNSKYITSIYNATDDTFINFVDNGPIAAFDYKIVNNGTEINSGNASFVKLPILDSTQSMKFEGWSDGNKVYPGGTVIVLEKNTQFTAVWSPIETTTEPVIVPSRDNTTASATSEITTAATTTTVSTPATTTVTATATVTTTASATKTTAKSTAKKTTKPKKTSIKKLKSAKKAITVSWAKISGVKGYQIQFATDKKFTKNKKTVTVKKQKTTSKTVKKLKAKKKYYVRVRTYKVVNKKNVYSAWSKVKSVKTK